MSGSPATGLRVSTQAATTPAGGEVAILAFEGDLDLATISDFEAAVAGVAGSALVVDLGDVRFIDSSGIHAVVRASIAAAERSLRLALVVAPGSAVSRVLEISGLSDQLAAKPAREAALAALDGTPGNGAAT